MRTIGAAVRSARERRGLKVSPLAEKTKELGAPVHRVALPKIESGERDITVGELVAIAAALGVPPISLLFPDVLAEVEILPDHRMDGLSALGWFIGVGGSTDIVHGDFSHRRWFMPEGISTNNSMQIPLRILRIDEDLSYLYGAYPTLPRYTDDTAEGESIRAAIEHLEAERATLIDTYREKYGGSYGG